MGFGVLIGLRTRYSSMHFQPPERDVDGRIPAERCAQPHKRRSSPHSMAWDPMGHTFLTTRGLLPNSLMNSIHSRCRHLDFQQFLHWKCIAVATFRTSDGS